MVPCDRKPPQKNWFASSFFDRSAIESTEMEEMLVPKDPYFRLSNMSINMVPHIRLTDPDGDISEEQQNTERPPIFPPRTGLLAKQKSISCEVLHPATLVSAGNMVDGASTSINSSAYVNIPKPPIPATRNNLVAKSWESDIPSASSGPSPISSISTPRPSHESDCEATDNEGAPEIRFREQIECSQTAGPSEVYDVLSEYRAINRDELDLRHGSVVRLITVETGEPQWYLGEADGKKGLFPANYVKHIGKEAPTIAAAEIEELQEIGQGAFARVLKARYHKDGQSVLVALKKPKSIQDKRVIEDMKREAVMFQRLTHPNVVQLYGICLESPNEGLLLELCEGDTLATVSKKFSSVIVSVRVLVDWGVQIAAAMQHLVEHQYVHRDLKADNVLVKEPVCMCALSPTTPGTPTSNGNYEFGRCRSCHGYALDHLTLKITDFGLTREASDKRQSVAGTEAWMAPEAYKLKKYGEASDVWSFGVVLWELLTKSVPYEGYPGIVVAYNVAERKLNLPIRPEWPEKVKMLLGRCWDYDPTVRPSFAELHLQLVEYKAVLTKEEEDELQRYGLDLYDDLTQFYNHCIRDDEENIQQFKKVYDKMLTNLGNPGDEKPAPMIAPQRTTLRRKGEKAEKKKQFGKPGAKIRKEEIGRPQDFKHCISVVRQRTNSNSPTASKSNLQVICDENWMPGGQLNPSIFGTLPRTAVDTTRKAVQNRYVSTPTYEQLSTQHSISSPNLNGVNQEINGFHITSSISPQNDSLHRNNAIKKKKNFDGTTFDGELDLSKVSILATPRREMAMKVKDKRASQDTGNILKKFTNKLLDRWPRRHSRQDSEDKVSVDGDTEQSRDYRDHRSPRSPSESSQPEPRTPGTDPRIMGNLSRSPVSSAWINGKSGGMRPRGASTNEEDFNRIKQGALRGRGAIFQPTDKTDRYVKHNLSTQSPIMPGRPRNSSGMLSSPEPQLGIDDAVPTTPEQEYEAHFNRLNEGHQAAEMIQRAPNGYVQLSKTQSKMTYGWNLDSQIPPADDRPATTSFADIIPPQVGFRNIQQPVSSSPYTTISHYTSRPMHMSGAGQPLNVQRNTTSSNSPLVQTPPTFNAPPPPSLFNSSPDPVYISNMTMYQKVPTLPTLLPKRERPATLDLELLTPGESGISTGGSSLTSVPLEYAPAPPSSHPNGQSRPTTCPVDV